MSKANSVRTSVRISKRNLRAYQNGLRAKSRPAAPWVPNEHGFRFDKDRKVVR